MHSSIMLTVRRTAILCLIVVCALSAAPSLLSAQDCGGLGKKKDVTSLGKEFLLCFMQNELTGYDQTDFRYQDIYLASTDTVTTVTITCKAFRNWSKTITLNPHSDTSYRLSKDLTIGDFPNHDAIIEDDETIDPTVFRVIADAPIACYGMNNKQYTADAFLALPKNVAGIEYRVMSYYNSTQIPGMEMPSEFCVAAFDDNTKVTITPSALTRNGSPAGVPVTYVLNAGEAIQVQADPFTPLLDLTGSVVSSDSPVVVFGGHVRTEVPTGYSYNDNGNQRTSRDHLCEEMPPYSAWGFSFIAKNFDRPGGDILRVLAGENNTIVKLNGVVWGAPLMANKFRDYAFLLSDTAENNIVTVETDTSHPILVGMIAHSAIDAVGTGDPFFAIVPPLNQTFNDFTYFISNDAAQYYPTQQHIIIATEISGMGSISITTANVNTQIPASLYTPIPRALNGGNHYAAVTLNQTMGIHRIQSPHPEKQGFTILAYGWGDVISYGYTAGALLKPYQGIMGIVSPAHSAAPGPGDPTPHEPPPSITVRNILTEKVYFDSARITYTQNKQNIPVRLKKDIAMETGTIEMAEQKTLELTTPQPVQDVITGNIRIWYHSKLWIDMYPVDFPFVIKPQPLADVRTSPGQPALLENYPNPVSGKTIVHFAIPSRAYVSVKIYDALGRVVRTVLQSTVNSGDQRIQVNTKGMDAGSYTLELLVPELGISERRNVVVIE